jgi:hypothetical protein
MPNAVTSLAIANTSGSPAITLSWAHDGVSLDRFQVLYKRPEDSSYTNLGVAPAADFGAGPYSFDTATGAGFIWKVLALESDGTRSATNPTETFSDTIDGLWVLPLERKGRLSEDNEAWVGSDHPSEERARTFGEFESPFSTEAFTQAGKLHLRRGTIAGLLLDRNGLTAAQWLARWKALIRRQASYAKLVVASNRDFFPVELTTGIAADPVPGSRWEISVPYRELKR